MCMGQGCCGSMTIQTISWRCNSRVSGIWPRRVSKSLANGKLWPEWRPEKFCGFWSLANGRLERPSKTNAGAALKPECCVAWVARGSCREGLAKAYQTASCGPSGGGGRFGGLESWQTAGLNGRLERPLKTECCGLSGFKNRMLWPEWLVGARQAGARVAPGDVLGGFEAGKRKAWTPLKKS